ncbi:MAG: hypothetical protein CMJ23_03890 [Phycisphaerae bacterium]|nr:hypothetical protein [Phycisphaerae bacterium]
MRYSASVASFMLVASVSVSSADVVWDEAVEGDLSSDAASPTAVGSFESGDLTLVGSVQASSGDTRDYVTFNVAEGSNLVAMRLVSYLDGTTGAAANTGFVLIDDGTSSVVPSGSTMSQFLGGSHLNRTRFPDASVNMLVRLSQGLQGGTGFDLPLEAGDYTVEVQQTGFQLNTYEIRLEFEVVETPCPADYSGDGFVDGADLGLFLGSWGTSPCKADLNGDGQCNGADLGILLGAWGGC